MNPFKYQVMQSRRAKLRMSLDRLEELTGIGFNRLKLIELGVKQPTLNEVILIGVNLGLKSRLLCWEMGIKKEKRKYTRRRKSEVSRDMPSIYL